MCLPRWPADGVRRRGDARLQRIVGRRVFCVFVYCADHKTLAKQLAVERRVKRAAQRNALNLRRTRRPSAEYAMAVRLKRLLAGSRLSYCLSAAAIQPPATAFESSSSTSAVIASRAALTVSEVTLMTSEGKALNSGNALQNS